MGWKHGRDPSLTHHLFHHSQSEMAERAAAIHTMAAAKAAAAGLPTAARGSTSRSRNYFPIRRNYRRGQFTCRLPFERSADRADRARPAVDDTVGARGGEVAVDVGFSKSGKRAKGERRNAKTVLSDRDCLIP